jgi:hypothetical protein
MCKIKNYDVTYAFMLVSAYHDVPLYISAIICVVIGAPVNDINDGLPLYTNVGVVAVGVVFTVTEVQ